MSATVQAPPNRIVKLWRDDEGDWTWTYLERDAEVELQSNDSWPSREAARRAAELAYPGVEVWEPRTSGADAGDEVDRKREALLLLFALALLGLLFWGLRGRDVGRRD